MTPEENQILEQINTKLDTLLEGFGIAGNSRSTPAEREQWAKDVVSRYRERKGLKSSPEMGNVFPLSGKEAGKDERAKSKRT